MTNFYHEPWGTDDGAVVNADPNTVVRTDGTVGRAEFSIRFLGPIKGLMDFKSVERPQINGPEQQHAINCNGVFCARYLCFHINCNGFSVPDSATSQIVKDWMYPAQKYHKLSWISCARLKHISNCNGFSVLAVGGHFDSVSFLDIFRAAGAATPLLVLLPPPCNVMCNASALPCFEAVLRLL